MAHALVDQLRFTRSEWLRGLEGVSAEDGTYHPRRMNCISWIVGHQAAQEHVLWLERAQSKVLYPQLNATFKVNAPMSTPALNEMLDIWRKVTAADDVYLDTLTSEKLEGELPLGLRLDVPQRNVGSALQHVTYHCWYHIGEIQSIGQLLGQKNLPAFVGKIDTMAPCRPEYRVGGKCPASDQSSHGDRHISLHRHRSQHQDPYAFPHQWRDPSAHG